MKTFDLLNIHKSGIGREIIEEEFNDLLKCLCDKGNLIFKSSRLLDRGLYQITFQCNICGDWITRNEEI